MPKSSSKKRSAAAKKTASFCRCVGRTAAGGHGLTAYKTCHEPHDELGNPKCWGHLGKLFRQGKLDVVQAKALYRAHGKKHPKDVAKFFKVKKALRKASSVARRSLGKRAAILRAVSAVHNARARKGVSLSDLRIRKALLSGHLSALKSKLKKRSLSKKQSGSLARIRAAARKLSAKLSGLKRRNKARRSGHKKSSHKKSASAAAAGGLSRYHGFTLAELKKLRTEKREKLAKLQKSSGKKKGAKIAGLKKTIKKLSQRIGGKRAALKRKSGDRKKSGRK